MIEILAVFACIIGAFLLGIHLGKRTARLEPNKLLRQAVLQIENLSRPVMEVLFSTRDVSRIWLARDDVKPYRSAENANPLEG